MNISQPWSFFDFKGAENFNNTIAATALSDASSGSDLLAATLTANAHGYLAGSLICFAGLATAMYNGMKIIHAVAANTITFKIPEKFSALTPAGTETFFPGVTFNRNWDLYGFRLHMSAVGGATENLTLTLDAYAGSQYDALLYSTDMAAVSDIEKEYNPPLPFRGGDLIKFAYVNTNNRTWGLTVFARGA